MNKENGKYLKPIEPTRQTGEGYCGPASLEIALRVFGLEVDQDTIGKTVDKIEDGMSWDEMENAARLCGCSVFRDREASFDHLFDAYSETGLPIIVAWMSDRDGEPGAHFSVVKSINGQMITLADPQYEDFVTYSRDDFFQRWKDAETERAYMVIFPPEK